MMQPLRAALILSVFPLVFGGCTTTDTIAINRQPGPPVKLIVHFNGLKNSDGKLLAFVHDNAGSYYSDSNTNESNFNAFRFSQVTPSVPNTTVVFEGIPAGRYAVNGYHDEDDDGALDRMIFPFLGMPKEPYGISNNVWAGFSKASFQDALIDVAPPSTEITIKLSGHLRKLID
jgi:uncharacterized protein (DUF2141 family)